MANVEIYIGTSEAISEAFDIEASDCQFTVIVISNGEVAVLYGYEDDEEAKADIGWDNEHDDGNTYTYHELPAF